VLVELSAGQADPAELKSLAKDVAMHVAAASPAAALYVARGEVPPDVLEKEKEIYRAQAAASGKPPNVVDKIAEGKMKEYYATFCLLEQPFIKDPKLTVGQLLKKGVEVKRFVRYRLGEESGKAGAE
jgi:elongation factor Ts